MTDILQIDVGSDFNDWLMNRDQNQTDGQHNAVDFRNKYLRFLDDADSWTNDAPRITLDLSSVEFVGSSFANEAFAYFRKYATADRVKKVILFKFRSRIQEKTVYDEIETGYSR